MPPISERSLASCAAACRRALEAYADAPAATAFRGALRAVIAAIEMVVERNQHDDMPSKAELKAAAAVCLDAANTCRRHGLDETMLHAAAACERAAILLKAPHAEQGTPVPS
jgi:hypothetical protein